MSFVGTLKSYLWKRLVEKRDHRSRTLTSYQARVECTKNKTNHCYLWDISQNGVGLLVDRDSSFATGDEVKVSFPVENGSREIVRTGTVKTIKIYHPKLSYEPLLQLRCSIKFHEPLMKEEADSISVESCVFSASKAG